MADSGGNPTLPSLRELELEQLLREREQQLLDLTSEVSALRKQISDASSNHLHSDEAVSAAAMAVLMPHLVNERNALMGTGPSIETPNAALVAALRQRTTVLQEENDELYGVLRRAETGRLDEEAKGLRVLVGRLERALRESDDKVKYFAEEMEKTTEILARKTSRSTSKMDDPVSTPPYPTKSVRHVSPHGSSNSAAVSKSGHAQPPTGPRHKKPRTHMSPAPTPVSAPNNTRKDSSRTVTQESYQEKTRQPQRERERDRGHGADNRTDREWEREKSQPSQQARNAAMEVDRRDRDRPAGRAERERDRGSRERVGDRMRNDGDTNGGLQIRGSARHRGGEGGAGAQGQGRSPRRGPGTGSAQGQGSNGRANGLPNRPDNGYRGPRGEDGLVTAGYIGILSALLCPVRVL